MRPLRGIPPEIAQKARREADIELGRGLNLLDIRLSQLQAQGLDIALQMLDLAPADDGEHVGRFVQHVRQRHGRERCIQSTGHFFQHGGDLLVFG